MENSTREKLIRAFKSVFDGFSDSQLSEDLALDQVPDWDSMNSINLQLALETEFSVELKDVALSGTDRVSTILALLRDRGIKV